jgi:hypothetical protein
VNDDATGIAALRLPNDLTVRFVGRICHQALFGLASSANRIVRLDLLGTFSHGTLGEDGMAAIARLTSLGTLALANHRFPSESILRLAALTALTEISFVFDEAEAMAPRLQVLAFLTSLRVLSIKADEMMDDTATHLAGLTMLEVLDIGDVNEFGDEDLDVLTAALTRLTSLDLACADITDQGAALLARLPLLQKLGLSECVELSDLAVVGLVAALPALRHLDLRNVELSDAAVLHLASAHQLTHLVLSVQLWVSDLRPLSALTALEQLSIYCADFNIALPPVLPALRFLATSCSSSQMRHFCAYSMLRKLVLVDGTHIDNEAFAFADADIKTMVRALPALEMLYISNCSAMTDDGAEQLSLLSRLQVLYLKFAYHITDVGVARLARCHGVRDLGLHGVRHLTNAGLAAVGCMPNLAHFSLWLDGGGHTVISTVGLRHLLHDAPALTMFSVCAPAGHQLHDSLAAYQGPISTRLPCKVRATSCNANMVHFSSYHMHSYSL